MNSRQEILAQLAQIEKELSIKSLTLSQSQAELDKLKNAFLAESDQSKINQLSQQIQQLSRTIAAISQQVTDLNNRKIQLQRQLNSVTPVDVITPVAESGAERTVVESAGGAILPATPRVPTNAQTTPTVSNGAVAFGTDGRVLPTSVAKHLLVTQWLGKEC
jgi:TolA-binding protein